MLNSKTAMDVPNTEEKLVKKTFSKFIGKWRAERRAEFFVLQIWRFSHMVAKIKK